jgi:CxxC motif-containing protein
MLPVISRRPLPKGKLVEAVRAMRSITVEAPVKEGDVIAEDIAGTGIDVIAARSL